MKKTPIQRVVVLMMENQSFDRALGFVAGDLGKRNGKILRNTSRKSLPFTPNADPIADHVFDPEHTFESTTMQLWGRAGQSRTAPTTTHMLAAHKTLSEDLSTALMRCFAPGTLPAMHTLAENFVVCDRWFASVPGATGPNRLFAHAATSGGYAGDAWLHTQGLTPPDTICTTFESLHVNKRYWGIYGHQNLMTALAFPFVREHSSNVHTLDRFFADCESGKLPHYCWLVPELWQQSQHPCPPEYGPPHGMVNGDNLIADVYEAIRQNPELWENTLLVITYDEAGGYADSVACTEKFPRIVAFDKQKTSSGVSNASVAPEWTEGYPDDHKSCDYDFGWVGVRVPAILVSAYLPRGQRDHTTYEHSCIAASLKHLFDLDSGVRADGFLTERDAHASSWFSNGLFNFDCQSRGDDAPMILPRSSELLQN